MRTMFIVATTLMLSLMPYSTTRADDRVQQNWNYSRNIGRDTTPPRTYRLYRGTVFDRLLELERASGIWPFRNLRR